MMNDTTRSSADQAVPDGSKSMRALGRGAELFEDPIAGRLLEAILAGTGPSSSAAIPSRLRQYRIERLLGRGNFGLVFKAVGPPDVGEVAIKFPRSELLGDSDRLERFKQEVRIASTLRHACIARFVEADIEGPIPFLVSEFCDGVDLGVWETKNDHRSITAGEAAAFIARIAEGVHAAHERGVIHRDLKPTNILLRCDANVPLNDTSPAVIDFGMARLLDGDVIQSRSSLIIGTPLYMAPEQAECRHQDVGPATDVFSLGAILYELLLGQPPFADVTYTAILHRLRTGSVVLPRRLRSDIPRDLEVVMMKCLEYQTQDRYVSAAGLAEDLQRVVKGRPITAKVPSRITLMKRWTLRPERIADAMSVIIAFCGVRLFIAYFGSLMGYFTYEHGIPVAELTELVMTLTIFTAPLEVATIWGAAAQRRGRLPDPFYWALFTVALAFATATAGISAGILEPPTWYQRNPAARLSMFQLIAATYAAQAAAWWIGDWQRIDLPSRMSHRRAAKIALTVVAVLSIVYGYMATH